MVSNPGNRWAISGTTFLVWGLAAASAVYWGFKLSSTGASTAPVAPAVRGTPPPDPAAIARLLGATPAATPAAPSLASRFQLMGVVAGPEGGGAALLAVDGRPPKPFRVGAPVTENLVLRSVEQRRITLAPSTDGPPALTLDMPLRETASASAGMPGLPGGPGAPGAMPGVLPTGPGVPPRFAPQGAPAAPGSVPPIQNRQPGGVK